MAAGFAQLLETLPRVYFLMFPYCAIF